MPALIGGFEPEHGKSDRVSGVLSRFLWRVHMITPVIRACRHQHERPRLFLYYLAVQVLAHRHEAKYFKTENLGVKPLYGLDKHINLTTTIHLDR